VLGSAVATWWADDLATADGGSVTSWVDRIHGKTLSTLNAAPVMRRTGGANSKPTIEFNGSTQAFEMTEANALSTALQGCVVVVGQVTTPTNGNTIWCTADVGSGFRYLLGTCRVSGGELEVQQRNNDTKNLVHGSTSVGSATYRLMEWSSSGTAYAHRLDNAAQTMTVRGGSNTGNWFGDTSARDNFTLGALHYSSVISYNAMKVSLVMVADAELSSGDRAALKAWVADYYALTLS